MTRTLREEIRQKKPFGSLEQEAYLSLVRTASALSHQLEQKLATAGITLAQYNVLRILRGSEPDGLCRNDLRDRMLTRMPDMTRLLDRMEEAGLVSRARDAEDRRLVTTRITADGRRILDDLEAEVAAEHRRALGHMGESKLGSLITLLAEVREAMA
jgi:DNA-binding MarR family transcriptional regulator